MKYLLVILIAGFTFGCGPRTPIPKADTLNDNWRTRAGLSVQDIHKFLNDTLSVTEAKSAKITCPYGNVCHIFWKRDK